MRDFKLYHDMTHDVGNYEIYKERITEYINEVRDRIPEELLGILKEYDISFYEYSQRFYDFDRQEFRKKEYDIFITGFCDRIETIEIMTGII